MTLEITSVIRGLNGSRVLVLLRKRRGSKLKSNWLFIILWVNETDVTAARVPTEKLLYAQKLIQSPTIRYNKTSITGKLVANIKAGRN